MRIILCGFGNPDNRGCEAIIRTTSQMIKEMYSECYVIASSNDYCQVPMIPLQTIDEYTGSYYPHEGELSTWIGSALFKVFGSNEVLCLLKNRNYYKSIGKPDLCISVGGDNFCYSDRIDHFLVHHSHFKNLGCKLVHWGSSFESKLMTKKLVNDLKRFDLIMVRESISYEAVKSCNIDNVFVVPDPAFIMESKSPEKHIELDKNCVGVNISPMIISKETQNGIVKRNAISLINRITSDGYQVVLIPHVAARSNGEGDYEAMKEILSYVDNPEKCKLIGYEYTAPEYKWIISQCEMFIGARTHSTIAAYSSCIPTVVLGYSVKARGIARDIFGNEENYVLPVQELTTDNDFVNAYEWLKANKLDIKRTLTSKMPSYINKSRDAKKLIKKVMKGDKDE